MLKQKIIIKIFAYLLIAIVNNASAQDCSKEALRKIKGVWLPSKQNNVLDNPAPADIAGAKKILDDVRKLAQEQYIPVGADSRHHYVFEKDLGIYPRYGNPYHYTLRNYEFYCLNGKKTTSAEGPGTYVYFNNEATKEIPIYKDYDDFGINSDVNSNGGFMSLNSFHCSNGKLPDVTKGYYCFGDENDYNYWFVRDSKLPFRYVSRKEFLQKQVAINEAHIKAFEKKMLSPEMKAIINANPEYKKQMMDGLSIYEKPLDAYKIDLKKDSAWLNEMAIVDFRVGAATSRYVFTTLDDPENMHLFIPIMPNPGYYNRKLPKWVPQYISINIRGNTGKEYVRNVRKLMEDNVEFFKGLVK